MNLNMGGYGIWLWPAYAITGLVFTLNWLLTWLEKKNIQQKIRDQQNP